jgi:dinuclear metal center YbgI/SA1388 family protein
MSTISDITAFLQNFAPLELAEPWDNVGLLLGDHSAEARRVMTCLTITAISAAEAIEQQAQLIVTHHPVLFRPTQRITTETPEGRMLLSLLRSGVAVYSPHTAFDNTGGGINDMLCKRLALLEVQPLRRFEDRPKCKIVVFVPAEDLTRVSDALFEVGAGIIGQYSQCSFRLAGTGTFFGAETTNPTVGRKGRREEVAEWRLELICPADGVVAAVKAMRKAHSYEEPAFDVYPLKPLPGATGAGRVGVLSKPESLEAFARRVKEALAVEAVQVIGDRARNVSRVGVACGAGAEFLADAKKAEADLLLTGEMRFHDQLSAQAQGLALVLPGHYASERPGVEELAGILQRQFPALKVWASEREADAAAELWSA